MGGRSRSPRQNSTPVGLTPQVDLQTGRSDRGLRFRQSSGIGQSDGRRPGTRIGVAIKKLWWNSTNERGTIRDCSSADAESWQNGYCTGLENRRPKGHGGSNPSLSAIIPPSVTWQPPPGLITKQSHPLNATFSRLLTGRDDLSLP